MSTQVGSPIPTVMTKEAELRDAGDSVIATGSVQFLIGLLYGRTKKAGGEVWWGDHYRVMKRRKDHPSVYMKCRKTGEKLVILENL